jgi:hypothetical protein
MERDLRQLRRDLYELTEKMENILGYPKRDGSRLDRIAAIEGYLGLERKIAA